jgi:hypothetical protein
MKPSFGKIIVTASAVLRTKTKEMHEMQAISRLFADFGCPRLAAVFAWAISLPHLEQYIPGVVCMLQWPQRTLYCLRAMMT